MTFEYQHLTPQDQVDRINASIRDTERRHFVLNLYRIAPDLTYQYTYSDTNRDIIRVESLLDRLHAMAGKITTQ